MSAHNKKEERKKLVVRIVCIALAVLMVVPIVVASLLSGVDLYWGRRNISSHTAKRSEGTVGTKCISETPE